MRQACHYHCSIQHCIRSPSQCIYFMEQGLWVIKKRKKQVIEKANKLPSLKEKKKELPLKEKKSELQ